nr:TPA_asm: hypothetical protein [Provittati virus]
MFFFNVVVLLFFAGLRSGDCGFRKLFPKSLRSYLPPGWEVRNPFWRYVFSKDTYYNTDGVKWAATFAGTNTTFKGKASRVIFNPECMVAYHTVSWLDVPCKLPVGCGPLVERNVGKTFVGTEIKLCDGMVKADVEMEFMRQIPYLHRVFSQKTFQWIVADKFNMRRLLYAAHVSPGEWCFVTPATGGAPLLDSLEVDDHDFSVKGGKACYYHQRFDFAHARKICSPTPEKLFSWVGMVSMTGTNRGVRGIEAKKGFVPMTDVEKALISPLYVGICKRKGVKIDFDAYSTNEVDVIMPMYTRTHEGYVFLYMADLNSGYAFVCKFKPDKAHEKCFDLTWRTKNFLSWFLDLLADTVLVIFESVLKVLEVYVLQKVIGPLLGLALKPVVIGVACAYAGVYLKVRSHVLAGMVTFVVAAVIVEFKIKV